MEIFRISNINKSASNECGGFRPPKGHLDTQMFPECEGTPTDRNIGKKHRKKQKVKKTTASGNPIFNLKNQSVEEIEDICDDNCGCNIIEAKSKKQKYWFYEGMPDGNKGKFTEWCKKRGFNGVCQSCITQAIDIGGFAEKMANLAIKASKGKFHDPDKKK